MDLETAKPAVVVVGEGRGFIIATSMAFGAERRLIITAAHCLPKLPPPIAACNLEEKTYGDLIGSIGDDKRSIWAECLFADPVADIAVLGEPDGQVLFKECEAIEEFVTGLPALEWGVAPPGAEQEARLLGLDGEWGNCRIASNVHFGTLHIMEAAKGIIGGMSGSPILNTTGEAVGVVSLSGGSSDSL